jgi:uncharacterized protein YbjQ (UPF0145 family)
MQRLKVSNLVAGKGAMLAGVQPGDVLISYAGANVTTNDELSHALQSAPVGGDLVVDRLGATVRLAVTQLPLGLTVVPIDYSDPVKYWAGDEGFLDRKALDERADIERQLHEMIVTTTPSVEGRRVQRIIDVVSAECVYGMNIFADFFAAITDIVGGRSKVSQNLLREARQTCIRELKQEALAIGANAVIGVRLDYSEFSGQGKSMLFLVASGTAVVIENTVEA